MQRVFVDATTHEESNAFKRSPGAKFNFVKAPSRVPRVANLDVAGVDVAEEVNEANVSVFVRHR